MTAIVFAVFAGALAVLNPCGIALLPALAALTPPSAEAGPDSLSTARAVRTGLMLTAGAVGTFGVVAVPMASVRSNAEIGKFDNRVSLMLPYLPVDKSDPEDQLRTVHRRLARAKSSGQRQAGDAFVAAANLVPFPLTAWTVRAMTRLPQRGVVTVTTNLPGPRQQMQVMGRRVVRMFPIPPIALGLRTGIAIVSYADKLVFGITGDYDTAPDVDDLARGIERAVERLVAVSTPA